MIAASPARAIGRFVALTAGAYLGLTLLGALSLYTAGALWHWPAALGGLLAGIPQAAPVTRSALGRRLAWPLASALIWLAWAGVMRLVGERALALVDPTSGTPGEIAQIAAPALLAGSTVVAVAAATLVTNARYRWRFSLRLATGHLAAASLTVAGTRAEEPWAGVGVGALVLAWAVIWSLPGQGTTTSE